MITTPSSTPLGECVSSPPLLVNQASISRHTTPTTTNTSTATPPAHSRFSTLPPYPQSSQQPLQVRAADTHTYQLLEEFQHTHQSRELTPETYQQSNVNLQTFQPCKPAPQAYQMQDGAPQAYQTRDGAPQAYQPREAAPQAYQQREPAPQTFQPRDVPPPHYSSRKYVHGPPPQLSPQGFNQARFNAQTLNQHLQMPPQNYNPPQISPRGPRQISPQDNQHYRKQQRYLNTIYGPPRHPIQAAQNPLISPTNQQLRPNQPQIQNHAQVTDTNLGPRMASISASARMQQIAQQTLPPSSHQPHYNSAQPPIARRTSQEPVANIGWANLPQTQDSVHLAPLPRLKASISAANTGIILTWDYESASQASQSKVFLLHHVYVLFWCVYFRQ